MIVVCRETRPDGTEKVSVGKRKDLSQPAPSHAIATANRAAIGKRMYSSGAVSRQGESALDRGRRRICSSRL